MQLVRNVGKMDRGIRMAAGATMVLLAALLADHRIWALVLAVAGLSTLASAVIGH